MGKPKKSVQEIVQKEYKDFAGDVDRLSVAELETRLNMYAKRAEEVEDAREADEELERTSDLLNELRAPYKDAKKEIRLKSRYLISLIKEKGGNA